MNPNDIITWKVHSELPIARRQWFRLIAVRGLRCDVLPLSSIAPHPPAHGLMTDVALDRFELVMTAEEQLAERIMGAPV